MADNTSKTTRDHDFIRKWAEERHGEPAQVKGTGNGEPGLLRLKFPDAPNSHDDNLETISWDDFFKKFDKEDLALVYQDETSGGQKSNFSKLVRPD